jgi:leucyl-tRNA synthetase
MKTKKNKYNFKSIEKKWQKLWKKERIYEPNLEKAKKPFYNLMMFPYPSAEGLHVGNMYAFTGSDIYGRFKRMQGFDVFEPIGLDGFGIHSENYALKINVHPAKQAKISEKRFYKQLEMIGNGFSWDEHLETYDPEYYKWTQWIFIQLFKNGLAYRKKQSVNWCLSCKTVLADEQVINDKCERCSNEVIKKELEQWFFKITKYANRLLKNLEKIDWSERVKIAQKNWIGKSDGCIIGFNLKSQNSKFKIFLEVFTTRPDTLFGCTYLVVAPDHPIINNLKSQISNLDEINNYIKKTRKKSELQRTNLAKEKTGVEINGIKAINPANKKEIPIWIADYVLSVYGTGAIMAVPAHDKRDFEFAKKFNLPIIKVIELEENTNEEVYEGDGIIKNSGKFDGLNSEKAKWEITKFVNGKKKIQYHLRDWLISRQRYWGPPIPIIYCRKCWEIQNQKSSEIRNLREGIDFMVFDRKEYIIHAVPEKDLPVKLPYVKDFHPKGTGKSPLATDKKFYEVKCPVCGKMARRETDVSDTFLDSAWYYLGYLMRGNSKFEIRNSKLFKKWCPVNMYIGGAEHSVLHLLYSRFLTMVFNDLGILDFEEPFKKFRAHGLLIKEGAKMSKSKNNIVNPDDYIKKFGADALRMYLMFLAPFEQGGDFRSEGILGITRFLDRIYQFSQNYIEQTRTNAENKKLEKLLHQTIKKVTEDIENLHFNTAISALMILFNEIEKQSQLSIINYQLFLKLLAPFAPHIIEELWQTKVKSQKSKVLKFKSIFEEKRPECDLKLLKEEKIILVVQINGKFRDGVEVDANISEQEAKKIVLSLGKIQKWLQGKEIKKIIFIPQKLINIVI